MNRFLDIIQLTYAWTNTRSIPAKLAIGVSLIVGLATIVVLGQNSSDDKLIPVMEQRALDSHEINALQLAFAKEGLNQYQINDSQVLVPKNQRDDYLKAIAKHDAIRLTEPGTREPGFNLFMSAKQQAQLQIEDKKQRLKASLLMIPSVDDAWIEYSEAKDGPFGDTIRVAVINLRMKESSHLNQGAVANIRRVTRGTFPGLRDDQIEIIDLENNIAYGGSNSPSAEQIARIKDREDLRDFEKRIHACLSNLEQLRINVSLDDVQGAVKHNQQDNFIVASQQAMSQAHSNMPNQLVGSNGQVALTESAEIPASYVENGRPTSVQQATYRNQNHNNQREVMPVLLNRTTLVNVSIGVPENMILAMLGNSDNTRIDPTHLQQKFVALRNQIEQTVRSQIPVKRQGNISIILEPEIQENKLNQQMPFPTQVRHFFEQNWKTVVLVVFGVCALLILRPNKGAKQQEFEN